MLSKGTYETSNSDLYVVVRKVSYQNKEYAKIKAMLINKRNGIIYEDRNYKVYHEKVSHWGKTKEVI